MATPKTATDFHCGSRVLFLLAAILASISLASDAQAARHWHAPVGLSAIGRDAHNPQVALSPDGDVVAVWQIGDRASGLIQSASRPVGGSWSAPVDLSAAGLGAEYPQVGLDAAGDATAVWESFDPPDGPYTVKAASKPAGGAWSVPIEISGLPRQAAVGPQLAVNSDGDAVAVWVAIVDANIVVRAASKPAGGSWSVPVSISAAGEPGQTPQVALDSDGDAVAVWTTNVGASVFIQATSKPAGGSWSAPVEISAAGKTSYFPNVALDATGNATAIWVHEDSVSNYTIQSASKSAEGSWSAPVEILASSSGGSLPHLALDAAGNATAVLQGHNEVWAPIEAVSKPAGGSWLAPVEISGTGKNTWASQVAANPAGDAMAVWMTYDGVDFVLQSASKSAGGSWSAPFDVSVTQEATFPQVALDATGDATAVWERFDGTSNIVQAADFDEEVSPVGPPLALKVEEGSGTVVSNPSGLECSESAPGGCTTEAIKEGLVTLTASPAPGYLFKSWKGCDNGGAVGRQCTVTLSGERTVGVRFYKVWNLEATKSNGQGTFSTLPAGINCGYGCLSSSADYREGSLTLKAKPTKNFRFVEFTGGTGSAASCNGVTVETCTIGTFNSDSAIEEVYVERDKNTLTLAKEGGGQGTVKSFPAGVYCGYTCGSVVAEFFASDSPEVSVTLNKGTTQVTWVKGAGSCTDGGHQLTCSVPMSAAHELVARFE